ncbi:hypothetical protein L0E83_15200, partial [Marichromatium gracile]|nr:hypothetical protein [Marichromatium gracile]
MAQQTDILSQDEIDALLHGVDSGDIDTEDNPYPADGQIRPFNLASEERIVGGGGGPPPPKNRRVTPAIR